MDEQLDCLILSAGFSSRMQKFKPLVHYENVPFILNVILKTSLVCRKIFIVLGYRSEEIQKSVEDWLHRHKAPEFSEKSPFSKDLLYQAKNKLSYIYYQNYAKGMFSSIQQGLKSMDDSHWILLHFVDQPHIPEKFYQEFSKQINPAYHWIQPQYQGQNAHPVIFNKSFAKRVINAPPNRNLKSCSQQRNIKKKFWNCSYSQVLTDFNTPGDILNGGLS
jgi:CTP:molybdopterin cytidylyltransferase MocA